MIDLPLGRRRLLRTAALTAGTTVPPSAAFAPAARTAVPPQPTADGASVITWAANGGTRQEWQVIAFSSAKRGHTCSAASERNIT